MPEMTFTVRWPDGAVEQCYSPSLVMHDFLCEHAVYPIEDFMQRTSTALTQASERVRAKYGFYCTSTAAQLESLHRSRERYGSGDVTVVAMVPSREVTA